MGELRNVETHALLYYPSTFHALAAVFCQLTGAAPTTAYTLHSLAASIWLFPVSAASLTWAMVRPYKCQRWSAGAAAAAALGVSLFAMGSDPEPSPTPAASAGSAPRGGRWGR